MQIDLATDLEVTESEDYPQVSPFDHLQNGTTPPRTQAHRTRSLIQTVGTTGVEGKSRHRGVESWTLVISS